MVRSFSLVELVVELDVVFVVSRLVPASPPSLVSGHASPFSPLASHTSHNVECLASLSVSRLPLSFPPRRCLAGDSYVAESELCYV